MFFLLGTKVGGGLPKLATGAKVASLGDSNIARAYAATTSSVQTTVQNKANAEMVWALGMTPRGKMAIWWDNTATAANDIPTYGEASAQDNLYRGAAFGYSGDTTYGITKRVAQVISSGAKICVVAAGGNTDSPNTGAFKITQLEQVVSQLLAADVRVFLSTTKARWSGDRDTLTDVASTTSGSPTVRIVRTAHGLTNTSNTTKQLEIIAPGLTIGGLTLSGIFPRTGGSVNVVDVNTIDVTLGSNANATVTNGGGTFTMHRNIFTDLAGNKQNGACSMPSDGLRAQLTIMNDWVRAQAGRVGVTVCDVMAATRDPVRSAITGVDDPYYEYTEDGVHLTPRGAYATGQVYKAALEANVEAGTWFDPDPTVSNLLANGRFTGTGGTANNGATGTLASNTFFSNVAGSGQPVTAVCSLEANAETGGQSCVLDVTSTGAGSANTFNEFRLSHTAVTAGFTSGQYVQALYEVELSGLESGVMPAYQATLGQGTTLSVRGFGQAAAAYNTVPNPQYAGRLWMVTEPLLIVAQTSLSPRLLLSFRTDVAGSCRIKVRRALLRVATSPVTEFPWVP